MRYKHKEGEGEVERSSSIRNKKDIYIVFTYIESHNKKIFSQSL